MRNRFARVIVWGCRLAPCVAPRCVSFVSSWSCDSFPSYPFLLLPFLFSLVFFYFTFYPGLEWAYSLPLPCTLPSSSWWLYFFLWSSWGADSLHPFLPSLYTLSSAFHCPPSCTLVEACAILLPLQSIMAAVIYPFAFIFQCIPRLFFPSSLQVSLNKTFRNSNFLSLTFKCKILSSSLSSFLSLSFSLSCMDELVMQCFLLNTQIMFLISIHSSFSCIQKPCTLPPLFYTMTVAPLAFPPPLPSLQTALLHFLLYYA